MAKRFQDQEAKLKQLATTTLLVKEVRHTNKLLAELIEEVRDARKPLFVRPQVIQPDTTPAAGTEHLFICNISDIPDNARHAEVRLDDTTRLERFELFSGWLLIRTDIDDETQMIIFENNNGQQFPATIEDNGNIMLLDIEPVIGRK